MFSSLLVRQRRQRRQRRQSGKGRRRGKGKEGGRGAGFRHGSRGGGKGNNERFDGHCRRCVKYGHKVVDCRVDIHGKGKGKGAGGNGNIDVSVPGFIER